MKKSRKWHFRLLSIGLVVGVFLGWMLMQMAFVGTNAAAQSQKKSQDVRPLPASKEAPPEVQMEEKLKKEKARPKRERRPTTQELLDEVRKQPGGKEQIERAKQSGARVSVEMDNLGSTLSWLSYLNPFRAEEAQAQDSDKLILSPRYPKKTSPFYGKINFYWALRGDWYNYPDNEFLHNYSNSGLGASCTKPYLFLGIRAPRTAWYLINFDVMGDGNVSLKKHVTSTNYQHITSWNVRSGTYYYPALVYLAQGSHNFYWVLNSGLARIYEVTVDPL